LRDWSPSIAIVPWRLLRRPALGDCELVGKAGCASSLESESTFGKRSRMSEGLPSGACWPALVRLTPGGVGFCNRRGAAVWSAPARRLPRLPNQASASRSCSWAIAQVRGSRRRAAADACFQRRWLQPNGFQLASDPLRPAVRAKGVFRAMTAETPRGGRAGLLARWRRVRVVWGRWPAAAGVRGTGVRE
jgi:hypothetical protein